jgi:signal transduction histidine kinase
LGLRLLIASILVVVLAQALVITGLVRQRWLRRHTERSTEVLLAELRASSERIHHLAARLITAQETERARIGRDLHDDINQKIAALAIGLTQVWNRMPRESPELVREIAALQDRAASLALDVRQLSHQLHSGVLQHAGLGAAIRSLCGDARRNYNLVIELEMEGNFESLPGDVALCIYRVAQECLRNTARHARATEVNLSIARRGPAVEMSIADNGIGFDTSTIGAGDGLGLLSLDERVRFLRGTFHVASQPRGGTRIEVSVPSSQPSLTPPFPANGATDRSPG